MFKVDATLHTDGSGFWSSKAKAVRITELCVVDLSYDGQEYGELRVLFDKHDWNCERDGDIYTDKLFEKELKEYLTSLGFDVKGVGYSEYGMQSNRYVSLDVGPEFMASWRLQKKEADITI